MAPRVCSACICGYNAIDFDVLNNTTCCYKGASECLCLTNERCLALDEEPLGWGMVTNPANKELCKLGLFCCTCGIKEIEVLCAGVEKLLCFSAAQSLPFKAEWGVPQCLCSVCFLSCAPNAGKQWCVKAPDCPRLKDIKLTNIAVKAQEMDDRPASELGEMMSDEVHRSSLLV